MEGDPVSLNFRGGNVSEVVRELSEKGYRFGSVKESAGGSSAVLRDPDGYLVFLDSANGEERKDEPMAE